MRDHHKLRAFELADKSAVEIYRLTRGFPRDEMYGLTSQMRRAAVSVPSNIVEGCARGSEPDFLRFLDIAFGSLRELRYQCNLANRLELVNTNDIDSTDSLLEETEKVLGALIRSIRKSKHS